MGTVGHEVVLRADRIAAGGDAIAREPDGRIVFVSGAIPGEVVRARIEQSKSDFAKARVVEVIEPVAARVVPPCAYASPTPGRLACGGCSWQHISPEHQVELKRELVADAMRRVGGFTAEHVAHTVRSGAALPSDRFRTTVRVAPDPQGRLGFRAARRNEVVPVDDCLVAHPALTELLGSVRVPGATEVVLRVGRGTGERLVRWEGPGTPSGVPADVEIGDDAAVHELVHGRLLRVSARSFFQSSVEAAEALVDAVLEAAGESVNGPVVDAYGGVGLFSAAVGADTEVTVVEISESSVADARVNLAGRPAHVVAAPVERWHPTPARLVIADPARRGLEPAAVAVLVGTGCERFVLVSCDAAAAARDTKSLVAAGFEHERSVVLDPFPHTPHVEVVTALRRSS